MNIKRILELYRENKDDVDLFLRVLALILLLGIAWYVGRISAFLEFRCMYHYKTFYI